MSGSRKLWVSSTTRTVSVASNSRLAITIHLFELRTDVLVLKLSRTSLIKEMLFSASRRISWTLRISGTGVASPRQGQNFCSWVRTSRSWISLPLCTRIISSSSWVKQLQRQRRKETSSTSRSSRRRAVQVRAPKMSASSLQRSFYLTRTSMSAIWSAQPKARSVTIQITW